MKHATAGRRWDTMLLMLIAAWGLPAIADEPREDFVSFLSLREIDQPHRSIFEAATEWNDDVESIAIKVLRRIDAPESLVAGWRKAAAKPPAKGEAVAVSDTLLSLRGRATFVAPRQLSPAIAEIFGGPQYDIVRFVDDGGLVVDVLTRAAPAAWPRWQPIDELAAALVLPLSTGAAPRPEAEGKPWPTDAPALVAAAPRVAWYPDTPLGRLGMDYGLFDTVNDGTKLVREDAAAFYAMLAAAGHIKSKDVAAAAGRPIEAMRLIDPGRDWYPTHRGDPVIIEGSAVRTTRVAIEDPFWQAFVGSDHYWEVFVFVETPLLNVNGRMQNSYPIVCCVRELPKGMPAGERISERVRVAAFAFKRYAYPFNDHRPDAEGHVPDAPSRRMTSLLVGPGLTWFPTPVEDFESLSIWTIGVVAGVVALAAIIGFRRFYRSRSIDEAIRKTRKDLPDRVELPQDDG